MTLFYKEKWISRKVTQSCSILMDLYATHSKGAMPLKSWIDGAKDRSFG